MRRAILLLGVALLGTATGCSSRHCDTGTLTVYWSFTDSTGTNRGCKAAGVTTIRIFVDGQAQLDANGSPDFACDPFGTNVEGITLTNFVNRPYSLEVEGFFAPPAAGEQPPYLDQRSVTPVGCGDTRVDVALAAQTGDLNVAYSFAGNCTPVTASSAFPTTMIWYQLLDANNQLASVADAQSNASAIPCSDTTRVFTIPGLLFGQYHLAGIEEVELDANGTTFIVYHYNCVPGAPFQHLVNGETLTANPMILQAVGGTVACF